MLNKECSNTFEPGALFADSLAQAEEELLKLLGSSWGGLGVDNLGLGRFL